MVEHQEQREKTDRIWRPRRVSIALLFGLMGFVGAFFTIDFSAPPLTLSVIWADCFPLLVSMAYGPRYALITSLLGTLYPFFIWETNGWANVPTMLIYVVWYVWHGYCARQREVKARWWTHPLLAQVPYALVFAGFIFVSYPHTLSLNPPFWPGDTVTSIPQNVLVGIITKSTFNRYLLVLVAVSLLLIPEVRRFLGLPVPQWSYDNGKIIIVSVLGSFVLWGFLLTLDSIFIDQDFPTGMITFNAPQEITALLVVLAFGFVTSYVVVQYMEQRHQAEAALRQSEANFRAFFDTIDQFLFVLDMDLHILLANRTAITFLGYTLDELLGQSVLILLPDQSYPEARDAIDKMLEGHAQYYTVTLATKEGFPIPAEIRIVKGIWSGQAVLFGIGKDISDLQASEEKFYRAFQVSPVLMTISGLDDERLVDVNDAFLNTWGFKREEVIGQCSRDLGIFDQQQRKRLIRALMDNGTLNNFEMAVCTKDGEERRGLFSIASIQLRERPYLLTMMIDITERKRAEAALRKNHELMRSILQSTPSAIFVRDVEGSYMLVNRTFEQLVGLKAEDMLGKHPSTLHRSKAVDTLIKGDQLVLGHGVPFDLEDTVLVGGEARYFIGTKVPLRDVDGCPYAICTVATDLTELKRAEAEREKLLTQVQDSARQIRHIIDTVPEGVLLLDMDLRVLSHNPLAREYLRLLTTIPESLTGETLTDLGGRPVTELLTTPPKGLWHSISARGHSFQVIVRATEISPAVGGWVFVIRDVTEAREIQQRVQRQERLASVGQLAAGIAHDFNNILAVITLYCQMSLRFSDVHPKLRERLQIIDQQSGRASDLINQILDFSRSTMLDRQPLDLVPVLKEQVKLWRRTVPESISIKFTYEADTYMISADPTRMQQVFMNLVVNARDAMPDGGVLHLQMERFPVHTQDDVPFVDLSPGDWIKISVSDTGSGIPDDVLPHIYDPFFTTKPPGAGTGLGLAQVYGIVTHHEGVLDVQTQMGAGTTFMIYLPALPLSSDAEDIAFVDDLSLGKGETVLVVEDNEVTRAAVVGSLELLNYQVLEAANGKEALDLFVRRRADINLVLTDLVMPEMGGKALARALHQQMRTMPIVVMSGHPLERENDALYESGVVAWIQKPPDLAQLAEILHREIRRRGEKEREWRVENGE